MTLSSSLLLAIRFLKPSSVKTTVASAPSNARKSLLGAVLCIGLSLVPLIVVLVVADGMIAGITTRMIELSSYHAQVIQFSIPRENEKAKEQLEKAKSECLAADGVERVYIERQGLALAAGKTGRSGATVRAVEPELFTANPAFKNYFAVHSGVLSLPDANSALIGQKLSETLGLAVGDRLRIITTYTAENGNVRPRVSSFVVSGIISSGYQELDALWVFIPLDKGFELLSGGVSRVFLGVQTPNAFSKNLVSTIDSINSRIDGTAMYAYGWNELNTAQYENYRTTRVMLLFIMFLILLVASVNVSSALIMLVMERRKEIALLKSVGASPAGITTSFLFAGLFTGLAGVLLGIPLGLLCAVNINQIIGGLEKAVNIFAQFVYILSNKWNGTTEFIPIHLLDPAFYLEKIPVSIPLSEVFLISAGTLVLSVIVSIGPARRAGKEKPLNVLRKY